MVGYPSNLNTKEDYLFVKDNFPASMWKDDFQALLDSVNEWFNIGEIKKANGIIDATHKIVEDIETGKTYQYELKENKDCKLYQLGFTVEEIKNIINTI